MKIQRITPNSTSVKHELQIEEDITTQHTNWEDPIRDIPITERAINYFANQIIIKQMLHSKFKPVIDNLYKIYLKTQPFK